MRQHQYQMQEYMKKKLGTGTATLVISDEKMKSIIKTMKSLEDFDLLLKLVSETIQNEAKEQ